MRYKRNCSVLFKFFCSWLFWDFHKDWFRTTLPEFLLLADRFDELVETCVSVLLPPYFRNSIGMPSLPGDLLLLIPLAALKVSTRDFSSFPIVLYSGLSSLLSYSSSMYSFHRLFILSFSHKRDPFLSAIALFCLGFSFRALLVSPRYLSIRSLLPFKSFNLALKSSKNFRFLSWKRGSSSWSNNRFSFRCFSMIFSPNNLGLCLELSKALLNFRCQFLILFIGN